MEGDRQPLSRTGWRWGDPPYFALIRGPFGRAGYQVATIAPAGERAGRIVLLFSSVETAESHRARHPQGHVDWTVGTLPDWKKVTFFLDNMKSNAPRVCLDYDAERRWDGVVVPIEALLEAIEHHVAGDGGNGPGLPGGPCSD